MRRATLVLSILFLLSVLACGPMGKRLTIDELRQADFGPYPDNYQELIKTHYSQVLFDPYSAMFTFEEPTKRYARMGDIFGWAVCGTLNAKNRMGGYVGAKPFYILISNGEIKRNFESHMARAVCKSVREDKFE